MWKVDNLNASTPEGKSSVRARGRRYSTTDPNERL